MPHKRWIKDENKSPAQLIPVGPQFPLIVPSAQPYACGMKSVLAGLAFALVPIATASPAAASEYSCTHVAAANGYVNESKYLWQVQQDCATAYEIAYPGGIDTQEQAKAAADAADQYLRSLGYDAETVEQMDIAGHGV